MAVILYKLGHDPIYVEPERMHSHIDAGWSIALPDVESEPTTEDLSNKAIRERAKAAGIEGWATLRIATLKEKLEGPPKTDEPDE